MLATALAGEANAIVTGGDDLRSLRTFQGVAILTPREFIARAG